MLPEEFDPAKNAVIGPEMVVRFAAGWSTTEEDLRALDAALKGE